MRYEIVNRFDASDPYGNRTIYTVLLNRRTEVDVMHKHDTGLVYVMEPAPKLGPMQTQQICSYICNVIAAERKQEAVPRSV